MADATTLKTFVNDGGERSVQDIVSKLKFIAKINVGEKLDVDSLTLGEDSWQTTFYLFYRKYIAGGETRRDGALHFLRQTIGDAFDMANSYACRDDSFYSDISNMLIKSLAECTTGVENLMKTYEDDRLYGAKLETLLETLEKKIEELSSNRK